FKLGGRDSRSGSPM
nr:encephalitogenic peptide M [Macaca mulatta]